MHKLYLNSRVDVSSIRKEVVGGRDHYVVPSFTLPFDVVMNGIHYPKSEIERTYQLLNNTLAPVGHPRDEDGNPIKASEVLAINKHHIGAWNQNAEIRGNRVYVEKWIDIEVAKSTSVGRNVIAHIEAGKPISTSVAVNIRKIPVKGKPYDFTCSIDNFDHDAILPHEMPAATIEQGVGMVINTEDAEQVNNDEVSFFKKMYNAIMSSKGEEIDLNLNLNNEEEEKEMTITKEDLAGFTTAINALTDAVKAGQTAQIEAQTALNSKLESITTDLAANAKAKLTALRTEVQELTGHSDVVVNALDEEGLNELKRTFKGEDPKLLTNSANKPNSGSQPAFGELTMDTLK